MRALLIALVLALAAPAAAAAQPYTAPGNKVLWGGQGGYDASHIRAFEQQSGKHPAIFNYFISWKATASSFHWLGFRLDDAERQGAHAMLSVSTDNPALSPKALAKGGGDRFLVGLNHLLGEKGDVVYLRPLSEMNNANNPYSAYDHSGRLRGEAFKPSWFKKAWRRLALIVRGGDVATVNSKLHRLGLPPVKASSLATPPVALLWVPLSYGNPETKANHPKNFYPGGAYVDWVGTTWYSPYKNTGAISSFYGYRAWKRKPFAFAEWGVWGADDPGFVHQFFGFLKSHRRARMAVYYQSASLKPEFALANHPAARAALRRAVKWPRLTGVAP
jgi:opacity protein-like surface antigen